MPAPRKERGLVLKKKRVFDRRISLPEARDNAGDFRRGSSSGRKRRGGGRVAGAVVRAKPRSLQAVDNASRSTSGPRAPRPSTPRTSKPSSAKKGAVAKLRGGIKKLRANQARNRAARARAKAKKLRGRG